MPTNPPFKSLRSPKRWQRWLVCLLFVFSFGVSYLMPLQRENQQAFAQAAAPCATPGKDGPGGSLNGIVNTYYPSPATASAAAGSTSIQVSSPVGAAKTIAAGDLLLVIQMQNATINYTNTDAYGDGTAGDVPNITSPQPSTAASGWLTTQAGTYEYVRAAGAVSGGTVSIAGVSGGLLNNYISAPASATQGQSTYQVIRVPQYSSATLGSATALPWNGVTGGILAYDVTGNLTLTGTVDVSSRGFRGGAGRRLGGGAGTNTDFRTLSTINANGSKGEGLAGTPRYILQTFDAAGNATAPLVSSTGNEGYPNGSYARGAPGTAGGGSTDGHPSSNDQNSGGGGGGNGGNGGRGGRAWSSQVTTGGFGGKEFFLAATDRLVLGGGGGAGTTNDGSYYNGSAQVGGDGSYSSGVAGGGMVFIRTNTASSSGIILATGANARDVGQDGGGGGGAGGSVIVTSRSGSLAGLSVSVQGGSGGNARFSAAHGPGGGGGGGVIVTNASGGVTTAPNGLDGGPSGMTGSSLSLAFDSEAGTGLVVPITAGNIPGIHSGAECVPKLTTTKTTSTPTVNNQPAGTTATYTITASNAASRASVSGITLSDTLPTGFTYLATTATTLNGGATQPSVSTPTAGATTPTWGNFTLPGSGSVTITFTVTVAASVTAGTYQNPAIATYLDPTRTITTGTTTAAYDPNSSPGEDVTVQASSPPAILLVKRITATNGVNITTTVDDPGSTNDNAANWPAPVDVTSGISTYLTGAINGGSVKPADLLDYTIYFLSNGGAAATNINLCDLVPSNSTFVPDSFGSVPESGINLTIGATSTNLTNVPDADGGQFFNPGATPSVTCSATNTNGAVVVNVVKSPASLPNATAPGTPNNSYGFIRFRARVN